MSVGAPPATEVCSLVKYCSHSRPKSTDHLRSGYFWKKLVRWRFHFFISSLTSHVMAFHSPVVEALSAAAFGSSEPQPASQGRDSPPAARAEPLRKERRLNGD